MQKETNVAVASRMTCKIGLIWRHMKTLYNYAWQSFLVNKFADFPDVHVEII